MRKKYASIHRFIAKTLAVVDNIFSTTGPLVALLGLFSFFSNNTLAQNAHSQVNIHEKVYQVELIVFERIVPSSINDPEKWRKNIALYYPTRIKSLIDPTNEKRPPSQRATPDHQDTPETFALLSNDYKELTEQARALRRRNHRLLFHETWYQPITSEQKASAIVLRGGEQYGDHYELEGSITFSVNRYLHAKTNLWLSQFEPNYGQAPHYWPPLPHTQETKELTTDAADDSTKPDIGMPSLSGTNPTSLSLDLASRDNQLPEGLNLYRGSSESTGELFDNTSPIHDFTQTSEGSMSEQTHIIKEIVTLRQSRKMRSSELHYIDHPRLGVLLKITPYETQVASSNAQ